MKKLLCTTALGLALSLCGPALADEAWPDLPVGFKSGVFGQTGSTAIIGLGSAGKSLFSMDLSAAEKSWKELAAFPGPSTNGAAFAMAGGKLYVFSGSGKTDPEDASPIIFTSAYTYDPATDAWSKIDTEVPTGLLGASAVAIDDDRIAFFGGYNKDLFDKYLHDVLTTDKKAEPDAWQKIVDDYMGMAPEDYRWNTKILVYSVSSNSWSDLGDNPYLPNCGSATVADGDGVLLINGEIKPGLRTPKVKRISFTGGKATWSEMQQLPALAGSELQEGLASPFAGRSNGAVVVAGGANFHGARARSFAQDWFTHRGYPKAFNEHVYVMTDGAWKVVNPMPHGLAYGASFSTADGILAVGGEDSDRKARTDAFLISWDGKEVQFQN